MRVMGPRPPLSTYACPHARPAYSLILACWHVGAYLSTYMHKDGMLPHGFVSGRQHTLCMSGSGWRCGNQTAGAADQEITWLLQCSAKISETYAHLSLRYKSVHSGWRPALSSPILFVAPSGCGRAIPYDVLLSVVVSGGRVTE